MKEVRERGASRMGFPRVEEAQGMVVKVVVAEVAAAEVTLEASPGD